MQHKKTKTSSKKFKIIRLIVVVAICAMMVAPLLLPLVYSGV